MTAPNDNVTPDDVRHLRRAVELAAIARDRGDGPFGAVLVTNSGNVLAEGLNGIATTGDIRAHAELDAITRANNAGLRQEIAGSTMYASGEPCPMCTAGMIWASLGRVLFAAASRDFNPRLPPGPRFSLTCADLVSHSNTSMTVTGPVTIKGALDIFTSLTPQDRNPTEEAAGK